MADAERTFSETEHFALLTDAVTRETAGLQSANQELEAQLTLVRGEKTTEVSELQGRLDILEAEKSAAEKAHTDAVAEFETYKSDLVELAEIETRKADRSAAVKEAAGELLDDDYITEARVQRWAEMSDEQFDAVLADFRDLAAKNPYAKGKKADDAEDKADGGKDEGKEKSRQTAAFTGGDSPTAIGDGTTFHQFLTLTGKLPATTS